jgi:hypothetical protein
MDLFKSFEVDNDSILSIKNEYINQSSAAINKQFC